MRHCALRSVSLTSRQRTRQAIFIVPPYWQWRLITHDPRQRAMLLTQFQESTQRARDLAEHLPEAQAAEAAFYLGASMACRRACILWNSSTSERCWQPSREHVFATVCSACPRLVRCLCWSGHLPVCPLPRPWCLARYCQQLIGIAGDRNKGLQALEQARTAGRLSVPEAGSLLAKIYVLPGEEQYDKAYVLLETWCSAIRTIVTTYRLALVCAHWGCGSARARSVSISLPILLRASHMRPRSGSRYSTTVWLRPMSCNGSRRPLQGSSERYRCKTQSDPAGLGGAAPGQRA